MMFKKTYIAVSLILIGTLFVLSLEILMTSASQSGMALNEFGSAYCCTWYRMMLDRPKVAYW